MTTGQVDGFGPEGEVAPAADFETSLATNARPKRPAAAPESAVPESKALREGIRARAAASVRGWDQSRPLGRAALAAMGESLLSSMGLGEKYFGFATLVISNHFWREQFLAASFTRRLLAFPERLKHAPAWQLDGSNDGGGGVGCGGGR